MEHDDCIINEIYVFKHSTGSYIGRIKSKDSKCIYTHSYDDLNYVSTPGATINGGDFSFSIYTPREATELEKGYFLLEEKALEAREGKKFPKYEDRPRKKKKPQPKSQEYSYIKFTDDYFGFESGDIGKAIKVKGSEKEYYAEVPNRISTSFYSPRVSMTMPNKAGFFVDKKDYDDKYSPNRLGSYKVGDIVRVLGNKFRFGVTIGNEYSIATIDYLYYFAKETHKSVQLDNGAVIPYDQIIAVGKSEPEAMPEKIPDKINTRKLIFNKFDVGDIIVSLTRIVEAREIGDMYKVLPKSSSGYLYYANNTSSNFVEDWRLATVDEKFAYDLGMKNISEIIDQNRVITSTDSSKRNPLSVAIDSGPGITDISVSGDSLLYREDTMYAYGSTSIGASNGTTMTDSSISIPPPKSKPKERKEPTVAIIPVKSRK